MELTPEMEKGWEQIKSGSPEQMLEGFKVWIPWSIEHAQGHYHDFARSVHSAGMRLYYKICFSDELAEKADNLFWSLDNLQMALSGI